MAQGFKHQRKINLQIKQWRLSFKVSIWKYVDKMKFKECLTYWLLDTCLPWCLTAFFHVANISLILESYIADRRNVIEYICNMKIYKLLAQYTEFVIFSICLFIFYVQHIIYMTTYCLNFENSKHITIFFYKKYKM